MTSKCEICKLTQQLLDKNREDKYKIYKKMEEAAGIGEQDILPNDVNFWRGVACGASGAAGIEWAVANKLLRDVKTR